jgi:pSer/pThr/pTyr-binding forkhead associated (FHA) protein
MNLTVSFFIHGHIRESKQIATPCIIGRSRQANWVLTHPMLSRRHCILFDKEEELYLCDDGSLNGIHFRGLPVKEPVRLQFGDEFMVGHDLRFRVSAPVEPELGTDRIKHSNQTTIIFTQDEFTSHQSTLLSENSVDE